MWIGQREQQSRWVKKEVHMTRRVAEIKTDEKVVVSLCDRSLFARRWELIAARERRAEVWWWSTSQKIYIDKKNCLKFTSNLSPFALALPAVSVVALDKSARRSFFLHMLGKKSFESMTQFQFRFHCCCSRFPQRDQRKTEWARSVLRCCFCFHRNFFARHLCR